MIGEKLEVNLSGITDQQLNLIKTVGQLVTTLQNIFPRVTGSFTCSASATTTVNDVNTAANSVITITPTNAAAGALMAAPTSLYLSARTAGASFAFSTANAGAAAGTETFEYVLWNPV